MYHTCADSLLKYLVGNTDASRYFSSSLKIFECREFGYFGCTLIVTAAWPEGGSA
jgi:hypothetical protein